MFRSRRLYANVVIFGSFLFLPMVPWYVPFVLGAIAAWHVAYYELIALGFLMDVAYGSTYFFNPFSWHFPLPFTLLGIILVLGLRAIKRRVRTA